MRKPKGGRSKQREKHSEFERTLGCCAQRGNYPENDGGASEMALANPLI
jgi:hypothetical protein